MVDAALMHDPGFSVEALMELSGLAVASAIAEVYPISDFPRVVAAIGPGGNGGDAMVAARHLANMGYAVQAFYPKRNSQPLYENLVATLNMMNVEMIDELPAPDAATVVVDGLFGFSFRPPVRPPFVAIIGAIAAFKHVVSVDVPSGWGVNGDDESSGVLQPAVLVSLTAPKLCARSFRGQAHYLGRVFVPEAVARDHGLTRVNFEGANQIVRLTI